MKLRTFVLTAALAVSALTIAACGGDDAADGGDSTATTAATTASESATSAPTSASGGATTAPSASANASPTTAANTSPTIAPGGGSLTGSGADELRAIAKDLSKKTYTVTYEFQEGSAAGLTTGTLTLSQKPPKSATTFTTPLETFTLIDDGVNSWVCSKKATDAEGGCVKSATSGGPTTAQAFNLDAVLDDLDSNVNATKDKDDTIAGRSAACFLIKESGQSDSRACFDKQDGFALLLDQTDATGVKFGLTATKVSNSVDENAFEPGYPVTDLP